MSALLRVSHTLFSTLFEYDYGAVTYIIIFQVGEKKSTLQYSIVQVRRVVVVN